MVFIIQGYNRSKEYIASSGKFIQTCIVLLYEYLGTCHYAIMTVKYADVHLACRKMCRKSEHYVLLS